MFRNLRFYRVDSPWPESEAELDERLSENPFRTCGAFSERSAGWEPPGDTDDSSLCRRLNGADLLQLRTQARVLPNAAVKEALEERVEAFRARMGIEPPRREIRRLKAETRDELLGKALLKSERTRACMIHAEALLAIDAASPAKAEWFIEQLRPCFGRFECVPLAFKSPADTLLKRIFLGELQSPFAAGRECRMQDPSDARATGTWKNIDIGADDIRRHVRDGMRLTHLGVVFEDSVECVLGEDGVIGRLRFPDAQADDTGDEDPLARLDADFVLLSATARRLAEALKSLLGGYSAARPAQAATARTAAA